MMAFVALEDLYGVAEVVVFPNVYEKCSHFLQGDDVIAVRGTLNFKEGEAPSVLADEIVPVDQAGENFRSPAQNAGRAAELKPDGMIKVRMPAGFDVNINLEQIKNTLRRHRGGYQVLIYLPEGRTLKTDRSLWAEPSEALINQLSALVGPENVKVQR